MFAVHGDPFPGVGLGNQQFSIAGPLSLRRPPVTDRCWDDEVLVPTSTWQIFWSFGAKDFDRDWGKYAPCMVRFAGGVTAAA